jgi:6-phosphogluconolactonase
MSDSTVYVFDSPEAVARGGADRFVTDCQRAIAASGRFSVVLAGGETPKRMYELLACGEYRSRVKWPKVHVFFGDERPVGPTHPHSNFNMAQETLLSKVYAGGVHRLKGEGDLAVNARDYEKELRGFFPGAAWPKFDLILLGMGDDGHTASLFPGTQALDEKTAWVAVNKVDKLRADRLTLTPNAINSASHVMFTVVGAGKAQRLAQVLNGPREPRRLPSQLVAPVNGACDWLVDSAAAARLSNEAAPAQA